MSNLLALENLQTTFRTREGEVHAVRGVSFQVQPGNLSASSASRAAGKASPVSRSFSFWGATDG
jgi:peptide/nickel transport system ATP-binding protein